MDDTARLLAFYEGHGRDRSGRTIDDVLALDLAAREAEHDYIQWLFPIPEPSGAVPGSPVLTPGVVQQFRERPELRARLRQAFLFMLDFLGLELTGPEVAPTVREGPTFAVSCDVWLYPGSHNFLRISRMLRSLRLLGLEAEAAALMDCLEGLQARFPEAISPRTMSFWRARARGEQ